MGILVALLEREVSGEGQWVHSNLLAAQIAMLGFPGGALDDRPRGPGPGDGYPNVFLQVRILRDAETGCGTAFFIRSASVSPGTLGAGLHPYSIIYQEPQ